MKKGSKIFRWVLIILVCAVVVIQFIRPARTNPAIDPTQTIESRLQVSGQVAAIFDRSCNDCHSNKTRWPWYSNVAPVSWFVIGHVNDARSVMNFSQWGNYDKDKQSRRLRDICEQVSDGEMPLSSYTPLHRGSKLSADDVKTLCDWTNAERARLSAP
ncbi:MAG TPA: heme-binding domain-containing protein [Pyrinomonadaceae bacterium]